MADTLNIGTFNVRGLRDYNKRCKVFNMLNLESFDVVFLQETHCCHIKEAKYWGTQYNGKSFWAFGSKKSCGVAILLSSSLKFNVLNFVFDFKGRFLVLDIKINNAEFRFINVYAPNDSGERKLFISDLSKFLVCKRNVVLGGDFNFVENIRMDKKGGSFKFGDVGSVQMNYLKKDFGLCDPFRENNQHSRQFTWERGRGHDKIQCRLDRFYLIKRTADLFQSIKHLPVLSSISDHCMVSIVLRVPTETLGPGYWKCNINTLKDVDFKADLAKLCERRLHVIQEVSPSLWDSFKLECRDLIKVHSKRLALVSKLKYKDLQREYYKYINLESLNPGSFQSEIQHYETEINSYLEMNIEGLKIRSKVKHLNDDEKPSRYFLHKEKKRGEKKLIDKLETNEGKFVCDRSGILKHVKSFYQQLFQKENIDQSLVDYFFKDVVSLTKEQADLCEGQLTKEECYKAIIQMKNEKSPGVDGLPKEFYQINWDIIGDGFVKMANGCFKRGTLSETQKLGIITLICKDSEKAHLLNYWRPISLLCCDYKIISKSITNRIKKVMGFLVNIDQTSAVIQRSIQENVHLLRNIVDYVNQKQQKIIILSLDQSKAFDRVDHNYMFQLLKNYGFGQDLVQWVSILYHDIKSTVLVNGWFTDVFPVLRSVRQGCSLSPLLYVLCLEPFATVIRNDNHVKGFKLPGSNFESKISIYADDCTFIVTDKLSVSKILNISDIFGLASGSKINKEKSVGLWLGNWGQQSNNLYGIKWSKESIKLCGIKIGNGDYVSETWEGILGKFKKVVNMNKSRNLKLKGKSVLLNSLAMSKIWYVASVFPLSTIFLCNFKSEMFSFIWSDKPECIKREALYNDYKNGGIKLVNIELKVKAFLIIHICDLIYGDFKKWKSFALYWLKLDLRNFLSSDLTSNNIPCSMFKPTFYLHALKAFEDFLKLIPVQT